MDALHYHINYTLEASRMKVKNKTEIEDKLLKKFSEELGKLKVEYKPHSSLRMDISKLCVHCGARKPNSQFAEVTNEKYNQICMNCAIKLNRYLVCSSCGKVFNRSVGNCGCKHKKPDLGHSVLQYNHKHSPKMFTVGREDDMFFGLEFEIAFPRRLGTDEHPLAKMKKIHEKDWLYFKHDGSIGRDMNGNTSGVEVVTHPLSIGWIRRNINEFDDLFDLKKIGYSSRLAPTCGFHVHMNKEIWGTFQIYKLLRFAFDNRELLHMVSDRQWSNLNQWGPLKEVDLSSIKTISKDKTCRERHVAINLKNPETIEFRIFKGCMDREQMMKNIEFCMSLYDFTRNHNLKAMKEGVYLQFIDRNKKSYPNIHNFLFSKDLKDEINGEAL